MPRLTSAPCCAGRTCLPATAGCRSTGAGRWRLRGEAVTHAGLNDFLNRQYAHDQDGNYFVQNGPQRVFVELEYTPWVLRLTAEDRLETHVGEVVDEIRGAGIDDEGNLLIEIPTGSPCSATATCPPCAAACACRTARSPTTRASSPAIEQPVTRRQHAADAPLAGPAAAGALAAPIGSTRTLWLRRLTAGDDAAGAPLNLRQLALDALLLRSPGAKCAAVHGHRAARERSCNRRPIQPPGQRNASRPQCPAPAGAAGAARASDRSAPLRDARR
jgi:hypothetical protein